MSEHVEIELFDPAWLARKLAAKWGIALEVGPPDALGDCCVQVEGGREWAQLSVPLADYRGSVIADLALLAERERLENDTGPEPSDAEVAAVACMDPRGGMPVCEECHAAHHARSAPIPRSVLRPVAFEFAVEHGLTWLLEKTYPGVQA